MTESLLNSEPSNVENNLQTTATETPVVTETSQAPSETSTTTLTHWLDSLPDDLKSNESLKKFNDTASLAKSYINAQQMIGNSIRIPTQDSRPEVKEEFFKKLESVEGIAKLPSKEDQEGFLNVMNKLGRPATPDAYEVPQSDLVLNDKEKLAAALEFKKTAHQLGLTNTQAKSLMEMDLQRILKAEEVTVSRMEAAKEALKKEFGDAFDTKVGLAKITAQQIIEKYPAFKDTLTNPLVGTNPLLIHALAELGKVYQERGLVSSNIRSNSLTPDEIRAKISEIRGNLSDPFFDASHPEHKARVDLVSKLHSLLPQ
jgi:DNA gyrase/topoisomerase IV subunit A